MKHFKQVSVAKADDAKSLGSWASEHSGLACLLSLVAGGGVGAFIKGRVENAS